MGLAHALQNITKPVTDVVDYAIRTMRLDVRDAAAGETHRALARAEAHRRDGARAALAPLDDAASVAAQVRDETLAQIDRFKQTIRKNI